MNLACVSDVLNEILRGKWGEICVTFSEFTRKYWKKNSYIHATECKI